MGNPSDRGKTKGIWPDPLSWLELPLVGMVGRAETRMLEAERPRRAAEVKENMLVINYWSAK